MRDIGAALWPFNALLLLQALETRSLRMERHVANAQAVAEWLDARDEVEWVWFAGLPSSPLYAAARKYMPTGAGSIILFGISGGAAAGSTLVDILADLEAGFRAAKSA
jgi:O-acetylhomoserine (thiol)-lyase